MVQCRNLLPVDKLNQFSDWLETNGYDVEETRAPYAVWSVRVEGKSYLVYVRDRTNAGGETVHASIYGPVVKLAQDFLRQIWILRSQKQR